MTPPRQASRPALKWARYRMIELRTLGRLDVMGPDGRELHAILAQPKRFALLAYLARASSRRFRRRDTLVALFWPELDQEHARAALRQSLRFLRRTLGDGALVRRTEEEVGVSDEAVWCDAAEFERACDAGRIAEALALYQGDFLEGFFIASAAPRFGWWLDEERARLRSRAHDVAWSYAEEQRTKGVDAAAQWARRAVFLAPDDEREVRRLITFLDTLGDRAGALRVHQEFARRLAEEYEVAPSAETQALIQAVRNRTAVPATVAVFSPSSPRLEQAQPATQLPSLALRDRPQTAR